MMRRQAVHSTSERATRPFGFFPMDAVIVEHHCNAYKIKIRRPVTKRGLRRAFLAKTDDTGAGPVRFAAAQLARRVTDSRGGEVCPFW